MPKRRRKPRSRSSRTTRSNHYRGCALEYNPRAGSVSARARAFLARHIEHHVRDLGMPPGQAIGAAYDEARKAGFKVPRLRANPKLFSALARFRRQSNRGTVIGDEAVSLLYRGGEGKRESRKPWEHEFEHPVEIVGNADGSVSLRSKLDLPLWANL